METATDIADFAANGPNVSESTAVVSTRWADLYELTKPRMNFLVVATTMVAYYMAVRNQGDWARLPATLIGTALTAAAASVFNQLWERNFDALMPRTRRRPLAAGRIRPAEAMRFGLALSIAGLACLALLVNGLTALLGAFTLLSYVLIYTPLKRVSTLNTVVGAIPGALPFVMGWTAARGELSPEAIALFAIQFIWQMPHFLAIAILYKDDYRAGGFKMLPVVDEKLSVTGRMIVLYSIALVPVTLMPSMLGMAGAAYFTAAVLLGLAFLSFGVSCAATKTRADARKLFIASIVYLPVLLAFMMIDRVR